MRIEPFNFNNLRDFSGGEAEVAALAALQASQAAEALVQEEEAPPPPPTFSETEMEQARQASRDRGYEDGIKAGREQVEGEETERNQHIQTMMQNAVLECAKIEASYQHLFAQQSKTLNDFVRVTAEKIAGDLLRACPQEAIEEVILNALPLLIAQPKLNFFVQKEMVDPVHKKILPHLKSRGLEADIDVMADDTMQPSDIRIEWKQGHVQRDTAEIMQSVHALLEHVDFGIGLAALDESEMPQAPKDTTPLELDPPEVEEPELAEDAAAADTLEEEAPQDTLEAEEKPELNMALETTVATDEAADGIEVMHASDGETLLSVGEIDDMVDEPSKEAAPQEEAEDDAPKEDLNPTEDKTEE